MFGLALVGAGVIAQLNNWTPVAITLAILGLIVSFIGDMA